MSYDTDSKSTSGQEGRAVDITDIFRLKRGFRSNSSSPTDVFLAKHIPSGSEVFLKLWISNLRQDRARRAISALECEQYTHSRVINHILQRGFNPHFILSMATMSRISFHALRRLYHTIDPRNKRMVDHNMGRNVAIMYHNAHCKWSHSDSRSSSREDAFVERPALTDTKYRVPGKVKPLNEMGSLKFGLIATESRSGDQELADWCNEKHSEQELWEVVTQVMCAIYTMHLFGVQHSDLHLGNVLIQETDRPLIRNYQFDGMEITVRSRWNPMIFDFDMSVCSQKGAPVNLLMRHIGHENVSSDHRLFLKHLISALPRHRKNLKILRELKGTRQVILYVDKFLLRMGRNSLQRNYHRSFDSRSERIQRHLKAIEF